MSLYPLLTGFLFLLPITIGVLGRASFPQLPAGTSADQILPLMLSQHVPPVIEALVLTAALAALMSTLDSQLLTLSSMFANDIVGQARRSRSCREDSRAAFSQSDEVPAWVGKSFVVGLALIGLAIAYRPPATFRVIATQTFTGLAVLFPTVIAVLYWKRMTARAGIVSILVGEALVVAYYFKRLPTFGTLPVVTIVLAASIVLVLVSLIPGAKQRIPRPVVIQRLKPAARAVWVLAFSALFLAAHDVWSWGDARISFLGYPWWVWMFAGLCVLTAAIFWAFGRTLDKPSS